MTNNSAMRGKPPIGTYAGRVQSALRLEQKTSRDGGNYDAGSIEVRVRGGRGPVVVDGLYEFTNITYRDLEFFKEVEKGQVILFSIGPKGNFTGFTMLSTKEQIDEMFSGIEE